MSLVTVLYDGAHYRAEFIKGNLGGLVITRQHKQGGVIVRAGHERWVDAIETAIDDSERHDICRAVLAECGR